MPFDPIAPEISPSEGRPRPPVASGQAASLILVVDDFEDNRSMYAVYLGCCGFDVAEAADGEEAINVARQRMPDAIVMDLSLPVMDGWEATRRLKGDERTRHIPIIALTGHALAGHSRGAREAGCDAFLAKPCLPEALVEKVHELLGRRDRLEHKELGS